MTNSTLDDLHGERAAARGNPSLIWRAGQDRRLAMIRRWAPLRVDASGAHIGRIGRVLEAGCGVGLYIEALQPLADEVYGFDVEVEHLEVAQANVPAANLQLAAGEALPFASDSFDLVLSHEVLEHVRDDRLSVREIVRVLRPGGRAVIFVPNRLYAFETHGHYWRGRYRFGNTPLINYLPDAVRNRLAPHVRAYTRQGLLDLFVGEPVRVVHFTQIYPGYDKLSARRPLLGRALRTITYTLERTPLTAFGISHLLVVEKSAA